jgi:hypothetical protein
MKFFIKLRKLIQIASVLTLIGCEAKLEPKEVFEVKIDGKIVKLTNDEILKFEKYQDSICKISDFFSSTVNITTTIKSKQELEVTTIISVLGFDQKDFKINAEKILLKTDKSLVKDLKAFDDIFVLLDNIKNSWASADVYYLDRSSFKSLKNSDEFYSNRLHIEKNKVVCETKSSQINTKNPK